MRVVVVGAGVLGTMHAVEACRLGHKVVHLEREAGSRGASVRNFGLVWVSGRAPGAELALAQRARELWARLGAEVPGIGFRANGSLTIARTPLELAVLEDVAGRPDAVERGFTVLDREEVRGANPAVRGEILGALHCARDAAVEPRLAPVAIREHLLATGEYTFLPSRQVVDATSEGVRDHTGAVHHADLVVVCTGAAHTGVLGAHLASAPLRRCRLQMLQTAPLDEPVTTSIADGDSLRYYPAFDGATLGLLPEQPPIAAAWRSQLLLVQRLDGSLTIGDTHAYDEPFPFDVEEAPYDHLRAAAEAILGRVLPPTVRRWAGVYSQTTDGSTYHRAEVAPGVVAVTGPGGRGMTLSPAIAEETFA
jgi:FAD dependent oxidoreductase TIGR03364